MRAELETAHISTRINTAMQMNGWIVWKECWEPNRKNSLWIETNGQMPRTDYNQGSIEPTERPTDRVINRPTRSTNRTPDRVINRLTNQIKSNQPIEPTDWPPNHINQPNQPSNQPIDQPNHIKPTNRPTNHINQPRDQQTDETKPNQTNRTDRSTDRPTKPLTISAMKFHVLL